MKPDRSVFRAALAGVVLSWVAGCAEPTGVTREWVTPAGPASAEVVSSSHATATELLDDIEAAVGRALSDEVYGTAERGLLRVNVESAVDFHSPASRDLYRTILLALDYAKATDGAYDPTAAPLQRLHCESPGEPTDEEIERVLEHVGWARVVVAPEARAFRFLDPRVELDLGPVGTGHALDLAARRFSASGNLGGLLRLGNAVYAWNRPVDEPGWNAPLPDPRRKDGEIARVLMANRALAVSGRAPGGCAIVDPTTGRESTSDVHAAAAVADSAADAGAMSRALLVAGSHRAGALLTKTRRVEAVLLVEDVSGQRYVLASASLDGRLELSGALSEEVSGRLRFLLPPRKL